MTRVKMTVFLVLYVTIYYYYYYTVKGSLQLQEDEGLARTANLITVSRVYFSRDNDFCILELIKCQESSNCSICTSVF